MGWSNDPGRVVPGSGGQLQTGGGGGGDKSGWEGGGGGIGGAFNDLMGGNNRYHQADPNVDLSKYGYGPEYRGVAGYQYQGDQAALQRGPRVDTTNSDQARRLQGYSRDSSNDALEMMRSAALGNQPSVAQQQLQMGRDQAIQNGMAMANSVRGGGANLAAAQMGAQRQAGEMMGQVNQQQAQLRAQEMTAARGQYMQAAAQQRAQDLQLQGLDADSAFRQAQLELQGQTAGQQYALGLYGLGQHAADSATAAAIKGQEDRMAGSLGAGQINAGISSGNAAAAAQGGSQVLGTAAGLAGAAMMFSDERLKSGVKPIGTPKAGDAEDEYAARKARLDRMLAQMGGGNDAFARGMAMGAQFGSLAAGGAQPQGPAMPLNSGKNLGAPGGPEVYDLTSSQANAVPAGPPPAYAGPAGMPMPYVSEGTKSLTSDERAKEQTHYISHDYVGKAKHNDYYRNPDSKGTSTFHMSPGTREAALERGAYADSLLSDKRLKSDTMGGGNDVDHFLGSLQPVSYHYKPGVPGEDPHAQRYGILAQDVARTPMGRSLVEGTPAGMAINVPHATGALLAGEGELYARQRRLEDQLRAVKGGR